MTGILSTSNVVNTAWDLFKRNASHLIVALFIYAVISSSASFFKMLFDPNTVMYFLASVVETVLNLIMGLGMARILLNAADSSEIQLSTLFNYRSASLILHYVIGSILMGIAIIVGLIFLIIPGLYIAARLQFFTYCLIEQDSPDFMKALTSSWAMSEGFVWDLVSIAIVSFFIILAGLIAFVVGLFVAIPLVGVMSAVAFRLLQNNSQSF